MKADPLADVALQDFVRVRNARVKELRAAGRTDEARALAARRRPSPSVWAVNRLAREQPEAIAELLAAGKALGAAQRGMLRSRATTLDKLRDAETALRAALTTLDEKLAAHDLSAAARRRAGDTLRAAATADEASRAALRGGRLESDLDLATGFGALGDVELPARAPRPSTARERKATREDEAAKKLQQQRRRQAERLRAQAEKAEARARDLRARAQAAASLGA